MYKYENKIKSTIRPTLKLSGNMISKKEEQTMIEISDGIYIGNSKDYENKKDEKEMNFINACKYPYWEKYENKKETNGMFVYENNRLICNLIDADDIYYIPKQIIEECIEFIEKSLKMKKEILINCNQGRSRSATIGLIYLMKNKKINGKTFDEVIEKYKMIVPRYEPNLGMLKHASNYYKELQKVNKND